MKFILLSMTLIFSLHFTAASAKTKHSTKVIAHRGDWKKAGSAQNSLSSLQNAIDIKAYGSEFDVNLTSDDVLVVIHGPWHGEGSAKMDVQKTPFDELRKVSLPNGEKLPALEEYLQTGTKQNRTRLILEIKSHETPERETQAVEAILDLVKKYQAEELVDYIAFSLHVCKELIRLNPQARVAYLNGDLEPEQLKAIGCSGLDYHYAVLQEHPDWFEKARKAGLTTNVWTVDDETTMRWLIEKGTDFITTNQPLLLQKVVQEK